MNIRNERSKNILPFAGAFGTWGISFCSDCNIRFNFYGM